MLKRLSLGPLMILLLVGGLLLDRWIDAQPVPAAVLRVWAGAFEDGTLPPGIVIFVAMLVLAVLGARELAAILHEKGILSSVRVSVFAAVMGLLASCLVPSGAAAVDAVAVVGTAAMLVLSVAIIFFARRKSVEGVVAATGGALLAFVYLGLMFGFLLAIRRDHSITALLWVLMVTKLCDIGAYFTGTAIGRHKLIPWLSPGKTWEGLFGGVAFSAIAGVAGASLLGPASNTSGWVVAIAAGVLGLVGQAGDLFESVMKRDAGIKDSGKSIPGFGGVLDVIDSPLLVAPIAYWWLRWLDLAQATGSM
ncbi:MAG: phosphatidate cytidylyltransferase [Planctomycetota bacterium]|nr:phosphatidate cytidylyltransferase [Planctomycetota bacterium]